MKRRKREKRKGRKEGRIDSQGTDTKPLRFTGRNTVSTFHHGTENTGKNLKASESRVSPFAYRFQQKRINQVESRLVTCVLRKTGGEREREDEHGRRRRRERDDDIDRQPPPPPACLRWRDSTRRALALSYSYSYFKTRIHGPLYR